MQRPARGFQDRDGMSRIRNTDVFAAGNLLLSIGWNPVRNVKLGR